MNAMRVHRHKHNLDIPYECNGFKIDDHVEYIKDGVTKRGYILCFRCFGYNWFAWIYFDKNNIEAMESIFVGELSKVAEE